MFVITFKHDKVYLPGHEPEFDGNYFYVMTYDVANSFNMSQYNGEYSFDKITWYPFPDTDVKVSANTKVYFRVDNPGGYDDRAIMPLARFREVGGNIVTLFNKYGIPGNYDMSNLFFNYSGVELGNTWNTSLVNAENLIIPSNYAHCPWMFRDCISLIKGPKILPATTLTKGCYAHMFAGCDALIQAPELPATTLAEECYKHMFEGCTSLTSAPELPAANIPLSSGYAIEGAYERMFAGCTNLNYVKCLATTGMMDGLSSLTGTRNWMYNVASTGTFIKAAGVEWPSGSYGIPKGWTVKIDGQYTITFANWDGTVLQTINVEEGQTPIYTGETPTRPSDEQYNYIFNGWTPTLEPAYDDIEYTASYTATEIPAPEPTIYTITFANWDGTILQTIQVEEGQTPVYTGSTPTRPSDEQYNYTFNGWSPTITEAIQDITYTAQYTEEIIEEPTSDVPQYLRFGCSNESGSATIKVPSVSLYPDLQYRLVKDNIEGEWQRLTMGTTYSVSNNQYIEFRGNNPTGINTNSTYVQFVTTGDGVISGNIMSLCDNGNHDTTLRLNNYAFYYMFGNTTSTGTLDASGLHLPYCSGVYCYGNLFRTNTALTVAPKELPAKYLTQQCYQGMFYNCTNLITGPEVIAANTVVDQSFRIMFSGCSKLTSTPRFEIKGLEGKNNCYNMFYNCTSLTDVNFTLPTTNTLTEYCYRGMFSGCTKITQAPELPAPLLVANCYYHLFNNCKKLSTITCLAVNPTEISNALTSWTNGVASSGTFYKVAGVEWPTSTKGIPSGWTVVEV